MRLGCAPIERDGKSAERMAAFCQTPATSSPARPPPAAANRHRPRHSCIAHASPRGTGSGRCLARARVALRLSPGLHNRSADTDDDNVCACASACSGRAAVLTATDDRSMCDSHSQCQPQGAGHARAAGVVAIAAGPGQVRRSPGRQRRADVQAAPSGGLPGCIASPWPRASAASLCVWPPPARQRVHALIDELLLSLSLPLQYAEVADNWAAIVRVVWPPAGCVDVVFAVVSGQFFAVQRA